MKLQKKILGKLILSCKNASLLLEKQLHVDLGTVEKTQLAFHKRICAACRDFEKKNEAMNKILSSKEAKEDLEGRNERLSDESKRRILNKLNGKK